MPPTLSQITANFFVNLITRLGVRPPPPGAFELSNIVQPISIVDADISIPVVQSQPVLVGAFSAGELAAPAVNTVLADTLALPAGDYNVRILIGSNVTTAAVDQIRIQRRDSANAANIWAQLTSLLQGQQGFIDITMTVTLANNERIRVITAAAAGGSTIQANIWASLKTS